MSRRSLVFLAVFALAFAPSAFAYLDPGTGSMVLQMVLGGIAGAAVLIKLYWRKLLGMFGVKKDEPETAAEDAAAGPSGDGPAA